MDCSPLPPSAVDWFKQTGALPVAMSHWGANVHDTAGVPAVGVIWHGIDLDTYKPARDDLSLLRDFYELNPSDKIIGFVGANHDLRKGAEQLVQAFALLYQEYPSVRLLLHMPIDNDDGAQPYAMAEALGLPQDTIRVTPRAMQWDKPTDRQLAALYGLMDVFCMPAHGEGFRDNPLSRRRHAVCRASSTTRRRRPNSPAPRLSTCPMVWICSCRRMRSFRRIACPVETAAKLAEVLDRPSGQARRLQSATAKWVRQFDAALMIDKWKALLGLS